ncbi:hypothetical protein N7495_005923 [Penicillium taxi]|uniref:uncharacterized protein n=1 Tax=Penicillium taxi TaxID=168475 RepID=UPI0025459AAD|nr:uncharacterized protein N7495_005923 [Penicillium taxi]KAJ5894232.1 hypothetical protein N7495_005923 [Penicillium taxi]
MPTELHDFIQAWLRNTVLYHIQQGLLTCNEAMQFDTGVGTKFTSGPYQNSRKESELFVRPVLAYIPTVVLEVEHSESLDRLKHDMRLILVGCDRETSQVDQEQTDPSSQRNVFGDPILRQSEQVFPVPPIPASLPATLPAPTRTGVTTRGMAAARLQHPNAPPPFPALPTTGTQPLMLSRE